EIFIDYLRVKFHSFYGSFEKILKNKKTFFIGVLFGILFWAGNFFTAYFLFFAFGGHLNFLSIIIVFTLGQIIGNLSPVPGGMGIVESIMTLLYTVMGVPPPLALLVGFLQRIIYYFYSLFLGGISLVNLKILVAKL
ncbi:flippase-like domain-containing protein, partial [Candidatus Woesearchaeota archaeon]|nr:flippase-like domain-containing protein [Candidatus Woesearchaeota archaeon]